jgi:protein-disulfide isomerase
MKTINGKTAILASSILLGGLAVFGARLFFATSTPGSDGPPRDKVESYVREKFGLVSTTKLTIGSYEPSADSRFLQSTAKVDNGKESKDIVISVSKDGRFLLLGPLIPISGDVDAAITQDVRQQFKIPVKVELKPGALHTSKYPGFLTTTVTATDGGQVQKQDFLVTDDRKFLSLTSDVYRLDVDPRKEALRIISLRDQPTQGPAAAPVTIVEYADLECPSCARMHHFLESEFLPRYGDKVRVVFKEFPLPMHAWSKSAAVANECAFQMDPSKYVPYRTLIFDHQSDIDASQASASDVRDLLLGYGLQAGLDRARLAACLDSQASIGRVEAGRKEGEELSVNQTPTLFVNGRVYPGPSPEILTQAVEDALNESKGTSARASR